MLHLSPEQLAVKTSFINNYFVAENAAEGSQFDANANVSSQNIATMEQEVFKDLYIQLNRAKMVAKIREMFDEELANEYVRQLDNHEIYAHDETSLKPYCASVSLYPFLFDGVTKLGGESKAPKHFHAFCGSFINLVFAISAQFAGAIATVEFLLYCDHFLSQFGDDYLDTHEKEVIQGFQHVVYSLNQPAAARGYQSVFWNISIYDRYYFDSMFGDFVFPDPINEGEFIKPDFDRFNKLQHFFMKWFNEERQKAVLTFPVVTAAILNEDGKAKDREFTAFLADEMSQGNSFFIYQSDSADSLASCCRLRNEISDNSFSYSLGAGGVSTGSINVITLNVNRMIQDGRSITDEVKKIHKYQLAYRAIIQELFDVGALPVYNAGFISLDKQFLTIGLNGLVEAAEFLGIEPSNNAEYIEFLQTQLKQVFELNKQAKTEHGYMFNTELVPAENLGVKNAKWDSKDGYQVGRDCYNSYFYRVEDDEQINAMDKLVLHGEQVLQYLDGGSALHLNLEEHLNQTGYINLIDASAASGCNYWCTNIKVTICNSCDHIDKRTLTSCSCCNSLDVDYGTRIIGYLKRVSNFSKARQKEHDLRHYHIKQ
ncbi:anaerobic ribonucleoside-triphosphate reductase [Thalassotalea sp. G2M2-11]|uniref:anaerobic ribonucleoside-triphosphate reductase n=1 Tax=Thalassotalea sp. G2M2-11 TaxID=2787627 RepID=UPI0019D0E793|nr:anaerobic ribonucleoside-triphosphate reductase [Thalassotalea sp. G2M2-11]